MRQKSLILLLVLGLGSYAMAQSAKRVSMHQRAVSFVKSLILPGWGQLSQDREGAAGIFFSVELLALAGYDARHSAGELGVRDYKLFADAHWDFAKWLSHDDGEQACGYIRTHQMPYTVVNGLAYPYNDHHYYENIGKYPEFICGWDDWNSAADEIHAGPGTIYTPTMKEYIGMRTASNEAYRAARVALTLTMINHLLSAFEAAARTSVTSYSGKNLSANLYIHPLIQKPSVQLEVKF